MSWVCKPFTEGCLVTISEAGPGMGITAWEEGTINTTYRIHDKGPHVLLRVGEALRPFYAWRPAYILVRKTNAIVYVSHFEICKFEDYFVE